MPVGYLAAAMVLAGVLLPTALRPPPDQQNQTASFSPDAPPDDQPAELVLQSLRQAQSSTAGAVPGDAASTEVGSPPPPPPPPPPRKAARGRCFGDPPRQTESLYSALCVPAWTGSDNGGATAFGVDRDEIRIGVVVGESSSVPEGFVEHEFRDTDSENLHHLKVWQAYFNSRFELYGRTIRFFVAKQSITDEDQQRASVRKMKDEGKVFAIVADGYGQGAAAMEEATRLGIVDFGSIGPDCAFYRDNHPYAFSFQMDGCKMHKFLAELACKQFGGDQPPGSLNEQKDPFFDYKAPRRWGLIAYQDESRKGAVGTYRDLMKSCGVSLVAEQEYNLTSNQQAIAGIMAKMRERGVTTILMYVDVISPIVMTQEASRLQYFPEYVQIGLTGNSAGRNMDDEQVKHMVGVHTGEIPRVTADTDPYRAYKEIDPDGDPDDDYFRSLQQLVGGIQGAGPHLTPESLWQGLLKYPQRRPDPEWSIGGGYGPDDFTYMDYVSLAWFNQSGDDPNSSYSGAWVHMLNGRRYALGEIPTEPLPWFDKTQGITSPERGVQG